MVLESGIRMAGWRQARVFWSLTRPKSEPKSATFLRVRLRKQPDAWSEGVPHPLALACSWWMDYWLWCHFAWWKLDLFSAWLDAFACLSFPVPGRSFFLSDPVRPVGGVDDSDGVDDARPIGRVSSMRRRVHRVCPWPRSTSNNHRCTVGRRFFGSDELASQTRVILLESRLAVSIHCRSHNRKFGKMGR